MAVHFRRQDLVPGSGTTLVAFAGFDSLLPLWSPPSRPLSHISRLRRFGGFAAQVDSFVIRIWHG
ncbi:hypothetical protein VTK26DRAFT_7747 [Humicola hyalothermophila]